MLTIENINKSADFYDQKASRARAQAEYHRSLGSIHANAWADKAIEDQRVANKLRSLAETFNN